VLLLGWSGQGQIIEKRTHEADLAPYVTVFRAEEIGEFKSVFVAKREFAHSPEFKHTGRHGTNIHSNFMQTTAARKAG
jgi:hypothetical protein